MLQKSINCGKKPAADGKNPQMRDFSITVSSASKT
jgi:hypothetical protein